VSIRQSTSRTGSHVAPRTALPGHFLEKHLGGGREDTKRIPDGPPRATTLLGENTERSGGKNVKNHSAQETSRPGILAWWAQKQCPNAPTRGKKHVTDEGLINRRMRFGGGYPEKRKGKGMTKAFRLWD